MKQFDGGIRGSAQVTKISIYGSHKKKTSPQVEHVQLKRKIDMKSKKKINK